MTDSAVFEHPLNYGLFRKHSDQRIQIYVNPPNMFQIFLTVYGGAGVVEGSGGWLKGAPP